jgi:hypothetical protein
MTMRSIQKNISDFSMIIGIGLRHGGAGILFAAAVIVSVPIDIIHSLVVKKNNTSGFFTQKLLNDVGHKPYEERVDGDDHFSDLFWCSYVAFRCISAFVSTSTEVAMVGVFLGACALVVVGSGLQWFAKCIEPKSEPNDVPFSYSYN